MHGENLVRKQDLDPDGTLWVQEIFSTIQGEGIHAGKPSIFIRLAGCNLQCEFCDTEFESAFKDTSNFKQYDDIAHEVSQLSMKSPGCTNIVITGGEPFRQNIVPLISHLLEQGFTIEIETAGTLWIHAFKHVVGNCHITVSPKTPKINEFIEHHASAYKFIVGMDNCADGDCVVPLTVTGKRLPMPKYHQPIFIQAMDDEDRIKAADNLGAAIELVKQTGWTLSVQIHKHIGVE